ncbi:divalent-cation tolerance protein CutA [Acidovorax sp. BL-A-41-H1]|uniref:divalent-cation tolerance protein CutA n=1 Tax=Acidovorax sp. BL-A-41-H1 TaxID=3421102 RepID=UPI003F7B27CA
MAPDVPPLALLEVCMVTTTVANDEEARNLAQAVLQARLAACVQLEPISSHYRWQGALQEDRELRVLCKTIHDAVPYLFALLRSQHPYTLPQLVVQPLLASADYAQWVRSEVVVPAPAVQA